MEESLRNPVRHEVEEYLILVVLLRRINLQQKNQEAKIVVWEVQCAYRG